MTAATLLCLTGVLTFDEAYANFANKNVIMIGGMFILSGALSKTSLVSRVRDFMVSHGDKAKLIIFLYMVINVLLIQVSMPTALASMFLPFMASFTGDSKVKASDLIYPGAVVAHCAQGLMPGAMFVLINSILEANNAGVDITAVDYSRVIFVPAIVALLYCVQERLCDCRRYLQPERQKSFHPRSMAGEPHLCCFRGQPPVHAVLRCPAVLDECCPCCS